MLRSFKIIAFSAYFHLAMITRQKETMFYAVFFPVFLFILFGKIWGDEDADATQMYVNFLLSGVIGMTISSDSLFGIGPMLKDYKQNNILKFLKTLPFNINLHFFGILFHTMVLMIITIVFLVLCSMVVFGYTPTLDEMKFYLIGLFIGILVFSFMSLSISFLWRNHNSGGFLNMIYFFMLFIGGTFYPLEEGTFLYKVSQLFPLTHLLMLIRGDLSMIWILLGWFVLFMALFMLAFRNKSLYR